MTTGDENTTLIPGGGVNITGNKIRISGDSEDIGISLTNTNTSDETKVPVTSVLVNDPLKVMFIVLATLVAGTCTLTITTRYSSRSTILKNPDFCIFELELTVA